MRRHIVFAALPACALLVFSPFSAKADTVTVPAPPGEASAVAAQVGKIIAISPTHALAKSDSPSSEAAVVKLFDQTLLGLGGTQKGDGTKDGALLDTGANNPIRLEVAPWSAAVDGTTGPTKHSKAAAAVAKLNVEKVLKVALLHSESEATWTDQKSTGSAFSNGVELGVADVINLVLLHSEVNSEGVGHSYLIDLNGNQIGTDSSLGQSPLCALTLQSVLALSCLDATGGNAAPGTSEAPAREAAEVAKVNSGVLAAISPVDAILATSSSGNAPPAVTAPAAPAVPAPALPAAAEEARAPAASAPAAALPRTGAALAGLAMSGLVALLGGALLRLASRRRVTTA